MKPNAETRKAPTPAYLRTLVAQSGMTRVRLAARLGVSSRMLGYYLSGEHPCPYPVQYALERLSK